MIPFRVSFETGASLFEQVVYASKKAMIAGQLRPGDPFPSVRTLSRELKINPNTAHKVVVHLIGEGLLETRPGIGTVVVSPPDSSREERTQLLGREIEGLVVEAKRLGIGLDEVLKALSAHWNQLSAGNGGGVRGPKAGKAAGEWRREDHADQSADEHSAAERGNGRGAGDRFAESGRKRVL